MKYVKYFLFPISLSIGMIQMVQQVYQTFSTQTPRQSEIITPGNTIINYFLQFFDIKSQQLIQQLISSLMITLSVQYVAMARDKGAFKRTILTYYSFIIDPIIIIASSRSDINNNQIIQCSILASTMILLRHRPKTNIFVLSSIMLSIFDPIIGILFFVSYIPLFDQFSFRVAGYSSIILFYHSFMKINGVTFESFLKSLTSIKQNNWVIYKIIPDNQVTRLSSISLVLLLIMPNLLTKQRFTYEKCYYLFMKIVLLTNICTLFFVSMPMLQTITLISLQLAETNVFYVVYATFIQIAFKTSTTSAIQIKLMYIAIFLLQSGVISVITQYLQIKVLTLKTIFMILLIVIPVAIYVFSLLSKFIVLKILQESFSVLFVIISLIDIETKFWNMQNPLVSRIIQGQEEAVCKKYNYSVSKVS